MAFRASIAELIAARAIQGIGAALLVPGSLSLISASFPPAERGRAIGTWSGFTALTAAFGPLLGGWLVEHLRGDGSSSSISRIALVVARDHYLASS